TKPVKLNMEFNGMVKDPQGQEKAGFFVSGKINRSDWGINLNVALETGGLMLGEDVRIQSEVQFVMEEINEPVMSL
ncbi:MAG: YceI family protein, partial [Ginsengibacter sp.]